ncbi:hypothetical protein JOC94_001256 [Bacillus thermophilus]|uniref:Uncharacterized protein n=1 Tax=Siminovitchia thermophila TaxID=1245522 RepID=A0ABS2R3V6_9BACI|nr:hypothetical protein [Siminovitchia thermophila]MBM7714284.1 hypothetical protein [Siminovitchia thermophila]
MARIIEDYLLLEEKVDTLGSVLLNDPYGIHDVSSGAPVTMSRQRNRIHS